MKNPVLLCSTSVLLACVMFAQDPRGAFVGQVSDGSGAVIPGVTVRATNLETNVTARNVTNQQGSYELPFLLPGVYRIEAEITGFKAWKQSEVQLRTGDRVEIPIALVLGSVTEAVEVTAQASSLENTNAEIAQVVGSQEISNLPLRSGNLASVFATAPGVVLTALPYDGPWNVDQSSNISVGGGGANSVDFNIDGVSNNAYGGRAAFMPPADMVQEVRVSTTSYDAATGHTQGGSVNIAMKSGTNKLHGALSASGSAGPMVTRNFFTNRFIFDPTTGPVTPEKIKANTPYIRWMQYTAVAGGPVLLPKLYNGRNRTFWMFGYQVHNRARGIASLNNVPTVPQRSGDFSALLALGSQYQIYDPYAVTPGANSRYTRQAIPGNIIPASRINVYASKMLQYFPLPNAPGTAEGLDNYGVTRKENQDLFQPQARIDHSFSESNRMYARYTHSDFKGNFDTYFPGNDVRGRFRERPHRGVALDDVAVLNSRMVLDVRYGFTWFREKQYYANNGRDLTEFGYPASLLSQLDPAGIAFPETAIGNLLVLGNDGGYQQTNYSHSLLGTLIWSRGNHSLKFGSDNRLLFENRKDYGNVAPHLDYAAGFTRGPSDNAAAAPMGQPFATFLFGLPTGGWVDLNDSRAEASRYYGLFAQDDWRVSRKLTLNLGLRWEYESPATERYDRSSRDLDRTTPNPIQAAALALYAKAPIPEIPVAAFRTTGGLTFVGLNGLSRQIRDPFWKAVMPRVGYAYHLTPRVVLRGGAGIFFVPTGVDYTNVAQPGFNQRSNAITTIDNGLNFVGSISNPLPFGVELPKGASGGLRTYLGRSPAFFSSDGRAGYTQRWSQSVQLSPAAGSVVELGYIGTRSVRLRVDTDMNQIPAQYLSTLPVRDSAAINFLTTRVVNPFFGVDGFQGSTYYAGANVNRSQLLRPFPQFEDLSTGLPAGSSWYHAMTARVQRRFRKGLQFQAAYTWSKTMQAVAYRNPTDSVPEHVISVADRPHRLVLSGMFELPFGRGKAFAGSAHGLLNYIIGGWQIQSMYQIQSGPGLAFGNVLYTGTYADIKLSGDERSTDRWFNPDGFARNSQQQLASNIRTMSSRLSTVRADGINTMDVSLQKLFKLREGLNLQLRGQAEGIANHPNFAPPNLAPTNTSFGKVTATQTNQEERRIFVSLKLLF